MNYEDMTVKELIVVINDKDNQITLLEKVVNTKDKELDDLESDINNKDEDIEKLENEINELENKLQNFEDLKVSGEIIKKINILTTDEVANIYYAIEESYHFQHLDKFKPL